MILPSKHISEERALLGVGAVLLSNLEQQQTVTSLWDKVRNNRSIGNYERFVLALDLLHITGVISMSQGMLQREVP